MTRLKTFPNGTTLPPIDELEEARLNSGMSKKEFARIHEKMKPKLNDHEGYLGVKPLEITNTVKYLDGKKLFDLWLSNNAGIPKEYLGTDKPDSE